MTSPLRSYFTPRLFIILVLGFFSGLPLALTASTLAMRLAEAGVDKGIIGLFAAVATPYALKFLWSPAMDGLPLPTLTRRLGRRRGWLFATQIALAGAILLLAFLDPGTHPWQWVAGAAFLVAFSSASQDIVIDAYRIEILAPEEQGEGAAMVQLGYRLGMLASGAGALYLASTISWRATYGAYAAIMLVGALVTLLIREPLMQDAAPGRLVPVSWLKEWVVTPFAEFMRRDSWWLILLFIVFYKFADAFIGIMTNPFFHDIGFTKTQIATVVKIYGLAATLLGTFLGGALTARFGTIRILFIVGFLHALTNLLYVVQAQVGADASLLAVSIAVENFTGGISAAAFVAYLSNLCNTHYTATQYALLSSLAAFGRTWLATPAGYAAKYLGWSGFFALSALLAVPGLVILYVLNRRIGKMPASGVA